MSFHDSSTQPPGTPAPGWYADPYAPPGRTGRRWWDGTTWSEHYVADPPGAARPLTPDGVPIAGVGARIGAYLIDGLVVGVVSILLGLPFLLAAFRRFGDFFERSLDAGRAGAPPPSSLSLYSEAFGPLLGLSLVSLAVTLAYNALFLRWRGATPGKLALGLQVRSWDAPGRLGWPVIARRVGAEFWYVVLGLVPLVGGLAGLYPLIDNGTALVDSRRRALHDRFADTVVVARDEREHRV